jgi:hypothetical protein
MGHYLSGRIVEAFLGFTMGSTVSHVGNSIRVFDRTPTTRNAVAFWIVTLVGLVINVVFAYVMERLGFRSFGAALTIFAIVPILNYFRHHCFGHRFRTFQDGPAAAAVSCGKQR